MRPRLAVSLAAAALLATTALAPPMAPSREAATAQAGDLWNLLVGLFSGAKSGYDGFVEDIEESQDALDDAMHQANEITDAPPH